MSGRFHRLEFTPPQSGQSAATGVNQAALTPQSLGTPVRTADHELNDASQHWRCGRFEHALKHFTRALGTNRALIPAWVGQVRMLVELGEYSEARLWSDKALELFKNNGELLAAKSTACLRMRDRRAAIACSDASLQSPGSSAARWEARGEVMIEERADRARDCFDKAMAEPNADWFDRVVVARIYLFHRVYASALEFAQSAAGVRPDHAYCWFVVGQCEEAIGWSERAMVSYSRSTELAPCDNPAKGAFDHLLNDSTGGRVWRRVKGMLRL